MKVRNEGKRLERSAGLAKTALRYKPSDTTEEQLRRVQDGLSELADVTVSQRRMIGHLTSIVVSGQLFNERTNRQLGKLLKNRP
jgi:Mg2+ and Co2+ transporter CorA